VRLTPGDVDAAPRKARQTGRTHNEARDTYARALVETLAEQIAAAQETPLEDSNWIYGDVAASVDARREINLRWLPASPQQLLERLFARPGLLAACAPELDEDERRLLRRPKGSPMTADDIPILDELAERLGPFHTDFEKRQRAAAQARNAELSSYVKETMSALNLGGGIVSAETVAERFPGLPHIVFGHSWGSMIARVLASRHPEGLAGLVLCGVAAQMRGLEDPALLRALEAAVAERGGQALDDDGLFGAAFAGALDRFEDVRRPTDWVALDRGVVEDHAVDPFNNFGAPMTLRFARDFAVLYAQANDPAWVETLPRDLPVLVLAGDQDPVANYGEGAYHVANCLWGAGLRDVRTRVYTGVRHEVHNEPSTRADVEAEVVAFARHCARTGL